jgi:hypothetical protein
MTNSIYQLIIVIARNGLPLSTLYPTPGTLGNRGEITELLEDVTVRKPRQSLSFIHLLFCFRAEGYNLDVWRKL